MQPRATQPSTAAARWPMTTHARSALVEEIERLRHDVETEAGASMAADGVIQLPAAKAARRLEVLRALLDTAHPVDEPGRAVIGRRVTIRESDGETATYALVFPGDGDPSEGWISADAPLGAAVLGRRAGDPVQVIAPAGRRTVTLLAVE